MNAYLCITAVGLALLITLALALSAAMPASKAHYSVCVDVSDALSMCVSGDKAAVGAAVREMAETLK